MLWLVVIAELREVTERQEKPLTSLTAPQRKEDANIREEKGLPCL